MFEDCEPNLIRTVDMQDTMPCRYLQLHLYAEVVPSKGQILMDTDHTLRYDDHKMEWYLKAIPTSIGGLAILIVFVAVVAGIALKCRQTSINSSDNTMVAACNPIVLHTTAPNDYTLDDNVAYSVPMSAQRTPLQDENIYEIVS